MIRKIKKNEKDFLTSFSSHYYFSHNGSSLENNLFFASNSLSLQE